MADEDVGETQPEQPADDAGQAVETADAAAAEAEHSESAGEAATDPGQAGDEAADGAAGGADAEGDAAAPDGDATEAAEGDAAEGDAAEGDEATADGDAGEGALNAVENIETQLGEVLSSLDSLADGPVADFGAVSPQTPGASANIDLLRDVQLNVKIELGRSRMYIEDILKLGEGSVVELDKLAGDPVDVFVNNRLVARGEVLVLNDNFCVRIGEIIAQD